MSEIYTIQRRLLCTEPVERAPRTLQGVHDVEGCHGFPLRVLRVSDGIPDDLSIDNESVKVDRTVQGGKALTFSRKILRTPRVSS